MLDISKVIITVGFLFIDVILIVGAFLHNFYNYNLVVWCATTILFILQILYLYFAWVK